MSGWSSGPTRDGATRDGATRAGAPMTERVRVTGPDRRSRPLARSHDIDEETSLGSVYVRSLMRAQLSLALGVVAVLAVTIGALPLLFHLVPEVGDARVAGLPIAWLVLGVLVYPWLLLLGWAYVRRAERNEQHFTELLGTPETSPESRPESRPETQPGPER
ncbi:hypothetical protein [Nocardioides sp.]|uniref:hypothetical protein n=1 Tax=Nocardioides sp. TaxID=35761 RepID=UPI00321B4316